MDETEYSSKPGIVAPTEKAHDSKAIAIQIEHLTLAGHVVYKGQSGDFLVCKYGLSRYCQDLAELPLGATVEGRKVNHAKGNGLTADNSQPAKTYKKDTNAAIVAPSENLGKPFANLRARCALAGIVLSAIENDHGKTVYIVSRWNMTRELEGLESVTAWLQKVTGVRA